MKLNYDVLRTIYLRDGVLALRNAMMDALGYLPTVSELLSAIRVIENG